MTTPVELINLALKQAGVLGVGQTATPEDTADSFKLLNMMMAQWSIRHNVVHQIIDTAYVGNGSGTYTVAPGAQFDTARPSRIFGAYCRQLNTPGLPVDYPLELLQSATDWGNVSLKNMASMPSAVWYDPQFPVGILHVWPIPSSQYEIHIFSLVPLINFATPYDDLVLPPEYEEAIMLNLAGRLCLFYQIALPQGLPQLAAAALEAIRAANIQIGALRMPLSLSHRRVYNFYSDI